MTSSFAKIILRGTVRLGRRAHCLNPIRNICDTNKET